MAEENGTAFKNPKHMEMIVPFLAMVFLIGQILITGLMLSNI
jgi:hypothetical protein